MAPGILRMDGFPTGHRTSFVLERRRTLETNHQELRSELGTEDAARNGTPPTTVGRKTEESEVGRRDTRQAMAAGKSLAFQYLDLKSVWCSFAWPEPVLPPHQGHFWVVNGMHEDTNPACY